MLILFCIFMIFTCIPTHAYLDPNTGSGLIAFIVAIFAGLLFYGKKIFYFAKNKLKK